MLLALTHDCNEPPRQKGVREGMRAAFMNAETVVCLRVGTTTHNTRHEITTHKMEVTRIYKGRLPDDKRTLYISTAGLNAMNSAMGKVQARFQSREEYVLLLGPPSKSGLGGRPRRSQGFPVYELNLVDVRIKILRVSKWEIFFLGMLAKQEGTAPPTAKPKANRELGRRFAELGY